MEEEFLSICFSQSGLLRVCVMFIHGSVASSLAIKVQVEIGEEPSNTAIRVG
jgi:hypothetical protein